MRGQQRQLDTLRLDATTAAVGSLTTALSSSAGAVISVKDLQVQVADLVARMGTAEKSILNLQSRMTTVEQKLGIASAAGTL